MINPRTRAALLLLVLAQACHSTEEYIFQLYDRLAPARAVSRALAIDPAIGFLIANTALVAFGLWCWAVPARRAGAAGRRLAWGWGLIETANAVAHVALAVAAGGYFPGLATAPLLLAGAALLITRLRA
jgi:hypothetical protein